MSSKASPAPIKQVFPVLFLELTDRSKSGFILEGTERTAHPVHLDGPGWLRILPESHIRWEDPKTKEVKIRKIRHIQGAASIFADEQDKAGNKFNPTRDNIYFKGTEMTVVRDGRQINMYDYLKVCGFNADSKVKVDDSQVLFRELHAEAIATSDVSSLIWERDAMNIIAELYEEVDEDAEGKPVYQYNVDRMKQIAAALSIYDNGLSNAELLIAINSYAKQNARKFVESVNNRLFEYRSRIKEAVAIGVLSMVGGGAQLVSTNKVFIQEFKSDKRREQVDELAFYFLSSEGAQDYSNFSIELDKQREHIATQPA